MVALEGNLSLRTFPPLHFLVYTYIISTPSTVSSKITHNRQVLATHGRGRADIHGNNQNSFHEDQIIFKTLIVVGLPSQNLVKLKKIPWPVSHRLLEPPQGPMPEPEFQLDAYSN
jgi:hypothetical protein